MAGGESRALDGVGQELQGLFVALDGGRESSFVPHAGGEPPFLEDPVQCVVGLGAHAEGLRERGRFHGDHHELLEVQRVIGVLAAVQDVHQRNRQGGAAYAPERLEEWTAPLGGGRPGGRQRYPEDRVGPQPSLVGRAIQRDHDPVKSFLIQPVAAGDRGRDGLPDVPHGLADPEPPVSGRVVVPQLDRLVDAGARPRGHARPARGS